MSQSKTSTKSKNEKRAEGLTAIAGLLTGGVLVYAGINIGFFEEKMSWFEILGLAVASLALVGIAQWLREADDA